MKLEKKTPLVLLIAALLTVGSVIAVTRYMLTTPTTIDITTASNNYVIELLTTSAMPLTELDFTGSVIADDPSHQTATLHTALFWINYENSETYTAFVSIESDQVDLYWMNGGTTYAEGELCEILADNTDCVLYINGMDMSDNGRTDIEIRFLVDDGNGI